MREALSYPIRGEHAEKAMLSAWLCVLVHAIALPVVALVPLVGYVATILASGDDPHLPRFLERPMLGRSLGATALAVGYGIVPVGAALVTIRLLLEGNHPPGDADALFVLLGSTAALLLLAGYAYVLPIALARYVRAGSLRAGVTASLNAAFHAAYFVGWTAGAVLLLVGAAFSSVLLASGGIGTVVGSLVGAYTALAASRRVARGYATATG